MMQQSSPLLVFRRLPESHGVVLHRGPLHQKDVAVRVLDTTLKLVARIPVHFRNNGGRCFKGRLELKSKTWLNIEYCDFENHVCECGEASGICQ